MRSAVGKADADGSTSSSRGHLLSWGAHFLLILPLLTAICFVHGYATAMPLTDEWHFLGSVIALQGVDVLSSEGLARAIELIPAHFVEHWVVVPFLYYWPVAEWAHFDSRWLIYTTVVIFAAQALIYRWRLVRSPLWIAPIVLLLFCPSHYMEFLWGWQFILAFTIGFALAGLACLDRMPPGGGWRAQLPWFAAGMLLLLCATFSSAGGILSFPCAALLVALRPMARRNKTIFVGLCLFATVILYLSLMYRPNRQLSFGMREAAHVLTALGSTIWGSPGGITEFGIDLRSVTGLVIVASATAVVARAARIRALPRLALSLSVTVFGFLCLASIAMARPYLGNWHLQHALPAVCGAYAAGYLLWKEDETVYSAVPFFTLFAVLVTCLCGYWKGFAEYGPSYHEYVLRIEDHARTFLVRPDRPKPYPPNVTLTPEMLLFLSAHEHPVFGAVGEPAVLRPLPETARVFLDRVEIPEPSRLEVGAAPTAILTVSLPASADIRSVMARIGPTRLVLRRLNGRHTGLDCCGEPGILCYSGMIVRRLLEPGLHRVELFVGE